MMGGFRFEMGKGRWEVGDGEWEMRKWEMGNGGGGKRGEGGFIWW